LSSPLFQEEQAAPAGRKSTPQQAQQDVNSKNIKTQKNKKTQQETSKRQERQ